MSISTLMSNDCLKHDLGLLEKGVVALRKEGHIFAARVLEAKLQELRDQIKRMDAVIYLINLYPEELRKNLDLDETFEDLKAAVYVAFTNGNVSNDHVEQFRGMLDLVRFAH